ncbi:hypothetical protein [Candidatus Magnetobacterium casense]|uniref:Scaffolding protein n=1 Tax=Candidatus Magnetobacterium casense TaxID=1455061 RepID=A0ABS6RUZ2_9BACT|nr:hypothetical protein [Candidatus Magnetobacterium casensis]MBV6340454.1 hypothetical protein [Candidatus Magnetobacterium casensis]
MNTETTPVTADEIAEKVMAEAATAETEPVQDSETNDDSDITGQGTSTETGQEDSTVSIEDILNGTPEKKNGVQKRIDALTKEKYAEKKKNEELAKKLEELERRVVSSPEPSKVPSDRPVPPAELEYDSSAEFKTARIKYEDDLAAWNENQRNSQVREVARQKEVKENEAKFAVAAKRVADKYPDFYDAINEMPSTPEVSMAILSSELAPEIGYFIAKNPDFNAKLLSLDPISLGREIGKLEVKFGEAKARLISKAPAPIKPIDGNDTVKKDPSKMTDEEWFAWEKAEKIRKLQAKYK